MQWVIEDRFVAGRPAFERHGAEFVADVEPFEHMKLRLLNGAHSSLAAIGRLAGLETVADTIEHPLFAALSTTTGQAVIPTLALPAAEAGPTTLRASRAASPIARSATALRRSPATPRRKCRSASSRPLRDFWRGGCPAARWSSRSPHGSDPAVWTTAARRWPSTTRPSKPGRAAPTSAPLRPERSSVPFSASLRCSATTCRATRPSPRRSRRDVAAIAAQSSLPALEERLAAAWA